MEFILIGETVRINRSDGRVHPAVVHKKQKAKETITTVWTENSMLMGKDVRFETILDLNPQIMERLQNQMDQLNISED